MQKEKEKERIIIVKASIEYKYENMVNIAFNNKCQKLIR